MATKRTNNVCCHLCCAPSVVICAACDRHFCWDHICEHRRTYEKYIDDARSHRQPLLQCLTEFEQVEKELHSSVDNWEHNKIDNIHRSADEVRKTLETHINNHRFHFEEESSRVTDTESTNRDIPLILIEKLQVEYGRALKNIRLVSQKDLLPMLQVETADPTREDNSLPRLSLNTPHQCGVYEPQTPLGKRLIREPMVTTPVGTYWAIGGSDEHLLVQEYENNLLTLFDRHGTRVTAMTWHYDVVVSVGGVHR
jgi:hypothetical protein